MGVGRFRRPSTKSPSLALLSWHFYSYLSFRCSLCPSSFTFFARVCCPVSPGLFFFCLLRFVSPLSFEREFSRHMRNQKQAENESK